MKLLRGYSDLGAKSELAAVGKAGACVDVNGCSVNKLAEIFCVFLVVGDYRFTVSGVILVDVGDRFLHGIY